MQATTTTQGVHHVGFTVLDITETSAFFCNELGFSILQEKPDYPAIFLSDGTVMLTFWQVSNPEAAKAFDRKNTIGLHHLALRVEDEVALARLHTRFKELPEVQIEFSPEPLATIAHHMMCAIPGGLRIEFIAPLPEVL